MSPAEIQPNTTMGAARTVTAYIKGKDSTGEVLAVITLKDGEHADSHHSLDCTRTSLETAFAEIFGNDVRAVFDSDIPPTDDLGLVFLP